MSDKFFGIIGGFCLPYLSETDIEKLIFEANKSLNDDGIYTSVLLKATQANQAFKYAATAISLTFIIPPFKT